jgi:thiamine-phosphate pyrophosphorylase
VSAPLDLRLYLVTDPELLGDRDPAEVVAAAVRGGVTAVQLRDKGASTRELVALARRLQRGLEGTAVPLIVNDRVDVALAVEADGAHVGQSDLPPEAARRLLGPRRWLGLSVTTAAEAAAVDPAVVDHVGLGPVFTTPTKEDAGLGLGLPALAALRARIPLPCVAIGGLDATTAAGVRAAGCDGQAVVRALLAADDVEAAARALRTAWDASAPA